MGHGEAFGLILATQEGVQALAVQDFMKMTPLHHAVDSEAAVRAILSSDMGKNSLFSRNVEGDTPLHLASEADRTGGIVRDMLGTPHGRSALVLQSKKLRAFTPLHVAASCKNREAVRAILEVERGRRTILARDGYGNTPLHVLSKKKKGTVADIAKLFTETTEGKVACSMRNNSNRTPGDCAQNVGNVTLAYMLAEVPRTAATDEEVESGFGCTVCLVKYSATG